MPIYQYSLERLLIFHKENPFFHDNVDLTKNRGLQGKNEYQQINIDVIFFILPIRPSFKIIFLLIE